MDHIFRIGETYRDTGSYRNAEDQFLRWIRGSLDSGIKNTGGIRPLGSSDTDSLAALVLVSNDDRVSQHEDPWEDTLAVNSGYISYWGDAKTDNPYDESPANRKIKRAFDSAAGNRRESVPPVLVFQKPEPGVVRFCGLCVPDFVEVRSYEDGSGVQIPNYLFHFNILNTQSVPVSWLHGRALNSGEEKAPDVWSEWVQSGTVSQWPTGERTDRTAGRRRRQETDAVEISDRFRTETFDRYNRACTITGIQEEAVLDLAHLLPRSDRPDLAEHPENVLVLNALHHRAFDARLFTLDSDRRIRVSPTFDPGHPFLRETLVDNAGLRISLPNSARLDPGFLEQLNESIGWL